MKLALAASIGLAIPAAKADDTASASGGTGGGRCDRRANLHDRDRTTVIKEREVEPREHTTIIKREHEEPSGKVIVKERDRASSQLQLSARCPGQGC